MTFSDIRSGLERGMTICPENYHIPNIREASLMHFYAKDPLIRNTGTVNGMGVSTYYSFDGRNGRSSSTWTIINAPGYSKIFLPSGSFTPAYFRCIRDLEPDEIAEVMAASSTGAPPAL